MRLQAASQAETLRLALGGTQQQLASSTEEATGLRLALGGTKQQMAKISVEAREAKETAEEMKSRVNKLNHNFIQTSACCCCCLLFAVPCAVPGKVTATLASD